MFLTSMCEAYTREACTHALQVDIKIQRSLGYKLQIYFYLTKFHQLACTIFTKEKNMGRCYICL